MASADSRGSIAFSRIVVVMWMVAHIPCLVCAICEDEIGQSESTGKVVDYVSAAICLGQHGAFELAIPYFRASVEYLEKTSDVSQRNDQLPKILFNLAFTYQNLNQMDGALEQYQKAIEWFPQFYPAYIKAAWIHSIRGEYAKAVGLLRKAIAINPNEPSTYFHLGNSLNNLKQWSLAVNEYQKGLELAPHAVRGHLDLADAYTNLKDRSAALEEYNIAYQLAPDDPDVLVGLLQTKRDACNWTQWDDLNDRVIQATQRQLDEGSVSSLSPYSTLFMDVSSEFQLRVAENWARNAIHSGRAAAGYRSHYHRDDILLQDDSSSKRVLRIGYISRKFEEYAGVQLSLGIFREHDGDHFQVYAYAHGPDDGSVERQRVQEYSDVFRDVHHMSSVDVARRIAEDGIHILVSFDGAHSFNSLAVLALRPAPIQVSLLGFAGSTGAAIASMEHSGAVERVIDYLIGDPIVTPVDHHAHYSERLAIMPPSYQPQDDQRDRPAHVPDNRIRVLQHAHTDGKDVFVFACFNRADKLEPRIFDAWMDILSRVPQSILWLYIDDYGAAGSMVQSNILRQAHIRGVHPHRLAFASRVSVHAYLERLSHADLFLDTLLYGAHTTATDALWMGVPVLTVSGGRTMASRVASSILDGLGVAHHLVMPSLEAYVERAVALGRGGRASPAMREMRDVVARHRDSQAYATFNTKWYVRHLEHCYRAMVSEYVDKGCVGSPQANAPMCNAPLMCNNVDGMEESGGDGAQHHQEL